MSGQLLVIRSCRGVTVSFRGQPWSRWFVALLFILMAVVTTAVALAVNAASSDERRWPWGLHMIQDYPFPSVLVLTVVLAMLSIMVVSVPREREARTTGASALVTSIVDASPASGDGGPPSGTGVIGAPLGELPVVVRGRDGVVSDLVAPPGAYSPQVRVLVGMGGCGKTTVALAAAREAQASGWRVWWVSAVDRATLVAGMSAVAREAGASAEEVTSADSDLALAGVVWGQLNRLSGHWLLVIDNADAPEVLAPGGTSVAGGSGWLRSAGAGVVVVTTRVTDRAVWGHRAGWFLLGELDQQAAALMLLDRMGRADEPELIEAATAVADRLGRLPLAVHLAGSYLGSGMAVVGLDGYLHLLTDRSLSVVDEGAPGWGEQDPRRLIMSTWEISLDALERQGRVRARTLLRVLSFLGPGSVVPMPMLNPSVLSEAGLLPDGDEGRAEMAAGLAGLRAVGLVDGAPAGVDGSGDGLIVHPLVAEVCRWRAARDGQRSSLMAAAAGMVVAASARLNPADPADWNGWQVVAPHARVALGVIAEMSEDLIARVVGVNNGLTYHYTAHGSYPAAIDQGEDVVAAAVARMGDEHPDTLMSRNNLAAAYRAAGRLGEAIPLYEATLSVRERVLGDEHPDTLMSRNNLAAAYQAAGRLGEAIPLYEATLAAYERVLGDEHPNTLTSRNNLAYAYQAAGRLGEAIPLYEATLSVRERVLGDEHPDTLTSRNNLAYASQAAGRLGEAIPLYEATLSVRERVLGDEHPDTLTSRNNLAYAYQAAGRLGEAIPLYEATLAAYERVLGDEHPNTLTSRNNLATIYNAAGRLGEAIPLHEATLSVRERVLGDEHPDTLTSRNNLAAAYQAAGRLGEAIPLHEATLSVRERVLGDEHPDTLLSRNNLAAAYRAAGRLGEAIPLYEATLSVRERVLGDEHPDTLMSRNNLAYAYQAAGRLGEAIPLYEATLAACERVLGDEHPNTLTSRNNLAAAYQAAGRLDGAIPLYEATLAAYERVLGDEHPDTLTSRNNLAYAYQAAGRLGEAIPLYEATLSVRERVLGDEHPDTLMSRNNLAYAYQAAGRLGEAIPLYEATLAAYERVLGDEHPNTLTSRNNLAAAYRLRDDSM
ncbi:FxSxx-COOH system tetratricopeptide repeat protein [Micromonospora sp. NBC_00821]|uniref:FxSxx-COOH system tetratricopeptide repeat protein n=1 Tax=Micromonospora sp. NBC_00821 TaxID=2975977 RepID=UPI002ED49E18|nr:FxSxx-COOH system tetratricopeptide repeat protein [Micromonospora sp. NBC_00821]